MSSRSRDHASQSLWSFGRQILSLVVPHWSRYALASLFMLLSLGTTLYYPWLLRIIVDEGIQGGRMERVNEIVIVMVWVLVVQAVASYLHRYLYDLTAARIRTLLQNEIYEKLLHQDMSFYDKHTSGELAGRLTWTRCLCTSS